MDPWSTQGHGRNPAGAGYPELADAVAKKKSGSSRIEWEDTMAAGTAVNYQATFANKYMVRYFPVVGRVLMGGLFFLSGLNGLLNFLPPPAKPLPEGALAFVGALM